MSTLREIHEAMTPGSGGRASTRTGHKRKPLLKPKPLLYRCQFCEQESPATVWKRLGDHCPKCGALYDAILAQEGDD